MPDKMKVIVGVPHHWNFIGLLGVGYADGDGSPDGYNTADPTYWERRPLDQIAFYEWFNCRKGEKPSEEKLELLKEFLNL